jgi:hypothetical protein
VVSTQATGTTCHYQVNQSLSGFQLANTDLSMMRATYQVTLRELRTHHKVVSARLIGSDITCPKSLLGRAKKVYSWPTGAQWRQVFDRYVSGTAPSD